MFLEWVPGALPNLPRWLLALETRCLSVRLTGVRLNQ